MKCRTEKRLVEILSWINKFIAKFANKESAYHQGVSQILIAVIETLISKTSMMILDENEVLFVSPNIPLQKSIDTLTNLITIEISSRNSCLNLRSIIDTCLNIG